MAPVFGQLVIGPPGSGKTTFCHGMKKFLEAMGRKVSVVNLGKNGVAVSFVILLHTHIKIACIPDPANDNVPYEAAVEVKDLVALEDVMEEFKLGPNGALIYCMEFLEKNIDWLINEIEKVRQNAKTMLLRSVFFALR